MKIPSLLCDILKADLVAVVPGTAVGGSTVPPAPKAGYAILAAAFQESKALVQSAIFAALESCNVLAFNITVYSIYSSFNENLQAVFHAFSW